MKRITKLFTILLVIILAITPSLQVSAASKDKIYIPVIQDYRTAQGVLKQINKQRKKRGLKALKMDKNLTKYAIKRSAELCVMIPWTSPHMRPNGARNSDTDSVVYECCQERTGYSASAKTVVDDWMESESHKAGILLSTAQSVGIACVSTGGGGKTTFFHYVLEFSNEPAKKIEKSKKSKDFNVKVESRRKLLPKKAFKMKAYYGYNSLLNKFGLYMHSSIETKESIGEYYVSSNNFKYKSSNTAVAKISKTGLITLVSPGTVTFTVTFKSNPKIKKKVKYKVTPKDMAMYGPKTSPTPTPSPTPVPTD